MTQAKLIEIAVKAHSGAAMMRQATVSADPAAGLDGDYHTRGNRQVTVVFKPAWDAACAELDVDLPWLMRRANLFVDGLVLSDCLGARLQIGDVLLEVTGETRPCHVMDEAYLGLRTALQPDWRAGVTCRIIAGGVLRVGDPVTVITPVTTA